MVFRVLFATVLLFSTAIAAVPAKADVVAFRDEGDYLTALQSMGYDRVDEGFENEAVWGHVRSTVVGGQHTAPSVTSNGITWLSNIPGNDITTSNGAARSGQWGFYSLPHGDPPNAGDGITGLAGTTLFAMGGWVRTNTPPAGVALVLDRGMASETAVDFDDNDSLGVGGHQFFGVINTEGFTRFDFLETEFDVDEQKFLFFDDYRFGFATASVPEPVFPTLILGILLCPHVCFRRSKRRPSVEACV